MVPALVQQVLEMILIVTACHFSHPSIRERGSLLPLATRRRATQRLATTRLHSVELRFVSSQASTHTGYHIKVEAYYPTDQISALRARRELYTLFVSILCAVLNQSIIKPFLS
jgi:hypothetical protein